MPIDAAETAARSDLNYDGRVSPVASNRLVVEADNNGDICIYTLGQAALVVDVNGVSDTGIVSFPNQRTDTPRVERSRYRHRARRRRAGVAAVQSARRVDGVAALTGLAADPTVTQRPGAGGQDRQLRCGAAWQWGLDQADADWRSTSRA